MTFLFTFSALCSTCFTLLGYVTDLITTKACSGVTVMMMVLFQTIEAFHLFTFFKAIFGYMSLFTTSIAFNKPIFIIISISNCLKISNRSFSFLLLLFFLLHLFYFLYVFLFLFINVDIIFINVYELNDFISFILRLLSLCQIFDDLQSLLLNFFDSQVEVVATDILNGLIALYFVGMDVIYFRDSLRFVSLSFLYHKNIVFWLSFRYIAFNLFKTINVKCVVFYRIFCWLWIIFTSLFNDWCILPIGRLNNFNRRRSISLFLSLLLCEFRLLRFDGRLPAIHLNHYS